MVPVVRVLPAVAVILALAGGCSPAELDVAMPLPADASWGDGHDGDETFSMPSTQVNECHPLTSGSDGTLTLASGTIAAGTLTLVWQVQDAVTVVSSAQQVVVADAGRWEVVRIATADAAALTVDPVLAGLYGSGGARRAQACTIPEYRSVTVEEGATVAAPEWDGVTGGFLGFFVRGELTLDGTLSAAGAGFRGTLPLGNGGGSNETGLTNNFNQAGGIGEGIDGSLLDIAGRGNAANGGGGGGAFNSGGGGGANLGAGGRGASQAEGAAANPGTFGHGGAALVATGRLLMGGGGGSGHQNDGLAGGGGDGGGVIRVRARAITGEGVIEASGLAGVDSVVNGSLSDGAGGGGAGGSIVVESDDWDFDGEVRALGGNGGSVARPNRRGLGGGGGGGRANLPSGAGTIPVLAGGVAGTNDDGSHLDATAGTPDPQRR